MSGTNENQNIFSSKAERKAERRQAEERKKDRARRKTRNIAITVILALVLLSSGAFFINSNYARRNLTAVSIAGRDFSAAEFEFFFHTSLADYQNMVFAQTDTPWAFLPQFGIPLRSQMHSEDMTWADFIFELAAEEMARMTMLYNAARDYGYVMRAESRERLDNEMEELRLALTQERLSMSRWLRETFGRGMNERLYMNIVEFIFTANSFLEYMRESFTYSTEELLAYYAEHSDLLDNFAYRWFLVRSENVSRQDFETDEEFEEASEEALTAAREQARQIAAGITTEEDFIAAARNHDPIQFADDGATLRIWQGEWLREEYRDWMTDSARRPGEVATFDTTNGTIVLYFVDRDANDYLMVEMRHILVLREEVHREQFEAFDDYGEPILDAYLEAVELMDQFAFSRAREIYNTFVEGGATEELLIEMMEEHSDDPAPGGLYTEVTKNQMVSEVNDWLFAPGRQVGDFELIRTEAFGYHLMFLSGFGEPLNEFIAESRMRERDHAEWAESLGTPEVTRHWAMRLIHV